MHNNTDIPHTNVGNKEKCAHTSNGQGRLSQGTAETRKRGTNKASLQNNIKTKN